MAFNNNRRRVVVLREVMDIPSPSLENALITHTSEASVLDEISHSRPVSYGFKTGLVYVFNLIVGTGALTLPAAFGGAGGALSFVIIVILAVMSFITVTFMVEAMAISNAVLIKRKQLQREAAEQDGRSRVERDLLLPESVDDDSLRHLTFSSPFEIKERIEMGKMAAMYFGRIGVYVFYSCIVIYLYGDLAIYVAAVSKSMRDVFCTLSNSTVTFSESNQAIQESEYCWSEQANITKFDAYRLFCVLFIVLLGPFVFFNVSKTKYLQITTTLMRWVAFLIMITLAVIRLSTGTGTGHPKAVNFSGLPNLFGVCVYSFMCHHSLPSLVTPIPNKRRILKMFVIDYVVITTFYLLLAVTGIFAFENLRDLYTLNFEPESESDSNMLQYFLALFPVFTLSTSFPIIAITLRNNLRNLFSVAEHDLIGRSLIFKRFIRIIFPLLAIIPPFAVAMFVEDVTLLTSITGSYAGAGIQYIIPVAILYYARKAVVDQIDNNPYRSPFRHVFWLAFVLLWAAVCILLVTINHFTQDFSGFSI